MAWHEQPGTGPERMTITHVTTEDQLAQVRALCRDYADALGIDLSFQQFDQELAALPGEYAPPAGCLLLALHGTAGVGCIALRRLTQEVCEGKRLYVRPAWRGTGLGKALKLAILDEARRLGYQRFRWDSLPSMQAANALYRSLGAKNIAPYCYNPLEGALFWELDLTQPR